ncbi:hypothetical protein QMP26_19865 [Enterocloster clostridioformis]
MSSDMLPFQDYMETDDFDTLEAPALMSSGDDTVSNSVDYSGVQMCLAYYDMSGRIQHSFSQVNDNGYASIARPSDYASPYWFGFVLRKRALPPAGKYKVSVHFGSNTFISYDFTTFWFGVKYSNVSEQGSQIFVDGTYSSGDFSLSADVSIGASTSQFNISNFLKSDTGTPPWGGYVSINFTRLSGDAPVQGGSPDSGNVDQDINQSISNNTAQQVEQGDTIIELIKNTIQTISSQLTAFWNQLAGEFTNLYAKMTQQHSEQLQADRDNTDDIIAADDANTDKVTGAIEKHGNFIIEGLKSLFIPSDEYFKSWFDGMYQFFNDRLGFLMLPVDLLVRMVDIYTSAGSSSAGIPFPEFKWMDGTVIIPAQTVQFDFLNTDWGKGIQDKLYFVGNLIMIGALLSLMHRKFEEVLRN